MSNVEKYEAYARRCMDKAASAHHAEDKRSWLLLAETWLDLIPGRPPIEAVAHHNQDAALKGANLRLVR